MHNNRDDFTEKTKDRMAKRVGYRCSNPNCRKLTCGATVEPDSFVNIGVAAHICAAAPGGKRYDKSMSASQRKSMLNGIWLCQSCAKLIDSDELLYTKKLLYIWKHDAEKESIIELQINSMESSDLVGAYRAAKDCGDLLEYMHFLDSLNREVDMLLARMEEIQEKLEAARDDGDVFWMQNYEKRMESLTSLYSSLNLQLRRLSEKAGMVQRYAQDLNTFAEEPSFSSFHNQVYVRIQSDLLMDQRIEHELIPMMTEIRSGVSHLLFEVQDLYIKRIGYEKMVEELNDSWSEKIK